MTNPFRVVIPARIASQRLHEKMLANISGTPLIVRTWQQASQAGAVAVTVATDDERIADVLREHGADVQMTGPHPTGTDRIAEVVRVRRWPSHCIVVNVQGDEPLIAPADIRAAAALLGDDVAMATLHARLRPCDKEQASVVKVVGQNRAHWFSRHFMPGAHRHLGVYAWRAEQLLRFSTLERAYYERVEMLEQLRAVENGLSIALAEAPDGMSIAVDTPEDLTRVRDVVVKMVGRA